MSYGDPDYGNPDYKGEPCPECCYSRQDEADEYERIQSVIGCGIVFIIALIAVIRSIWKTAKGITTSPFTGGWTIAAWVYVSIFVLGGFLLLIAHLLQKLSDKKSQ
jgi:hypothetical protein